MNEFTSQRGKRPSMRPVLLAVLASFILGGSLAGYGVYRWALDQDEPAAVAAAAPQAEVAADGSRGEPTPTPARTASAALGQTNDAVERVAEQQGGIDQRLAAAEQRLARLDIQAQAAAGNAARAEGLLIAFAARRAIEKGAELGFLADQLRLRFGDALPNAVRTIIANSRDPVTLDQLIARLEGIAPSLAEANRGFSWDLVRSELSQLFVVRRETTPSPQPQRRLDRARLFLESGRVEAAIEEVSKLPGAGNAEGWIADAQRFAATQQALDLVETSAVLEPRMLRDGVGNRIEQLSPVGQPEG
ncbi:hypothetical protein A9995_03685 [Erythrobacter sp. QSSC1-22B]|uniref:hypothetical protein n=1 Tax=Erythrobacter sp. QSSC1-22B TaxID=1860125 RepID=UPI0008053D84|nr:hypothetical protein [Erythrobacter sp. QSSC1-22B]OBX20795.1 hypothetical protein A9995_03685 [Erythrobacter sp. QSSC1-22B]